MTPRELRTLPAVLLLAPLVGWLAVRGLQLGHLAQLVALAGGALVGAIGGLAWLDDLAPEPLPLGRAPRPLLDAPRCPYCHGDFVQRPTAEHCCLGCGTPMHAACWGEHGGCSVYGCGGRRERLRLT